MLANWSRFRPEHNRGEGDRDVRLIASSSDLTFRAGRGSCVIDDYTTSKATYREIACLVSGPLIDRGGRSRGPDLALAPAGHHVGASRLELHVLVNPTPRSNQ